MARWHCAIFQSDPQRFDKFSLLFNDILLDYAKQPIDSETMHRLLALARQQKLGGWITRMFSGEKINTTEHRAALHIALRGEHPVQVDGVNVMPEVRRVLKQMERFTAAVHGGARKGYTGKTFTDIVNIGIGGSDLGPVMVTEALKPYSLPSITPHFVSNIDGAHLAETLQHLDPATTLFVIASKTFTTQETITNALSARKWFLSHGGSEQDIAQHFVAVSTHRAAVEAFGIDPDNMFEFWDWVGGRYSLWSAIGLPIALAIGMDHFYSLLAGARAMDQHFATTPLAENMPVILGLIGIWQINFFGVSAHAVLPYDQSMHRFPAYLQQLEMESNGKRVTRDGEVVDYATGAVVWGEPGTNGQHAFYQLLHQGTQTVSADFLAPCQSHHRWSSSPFVVGQFLGPDGTLMCGRMNAVRAELAAGLTAITEKLLPHNFSETTRPLPFYSKIDPKTLGSLIALS